MAPRCAAFARKMTPAQLEEAQRLAREWKPKPYSCRWWPLYRGSVSVCR